MTYMADAVYQHQARERQARLVERGIRDDFVALLEQYRSQRGMSKNGLADSAGLDKSYVVRITNGDRQPPGVPVVTALARALRLTREETGRLLLAAGYAGPTLQRYGVWDDTLETIVGALSDPLLDPTERDELATILRTVAERYQQVAALRARRVQPSPSRSIRTDP